MSSKFTVVFERWNGVHGRRSFSDLYSARVGLIAAKDEHRSAWLVYPSKPHGEPRS